MAMKVQNKVGVHRALKTLFDHWMSMEKYFEVKSVRFRSLILYDKEAIDNSIL